MHSLTTALVHCCNYHANEKYLHAPVSSDYHIAPHAHTVEDLERNDGTDRPYFMSSNLMKLLNAKNKKYEGTDAPDGAEEVELVETIQAWKKDFIV